MTTPDERPKWWHFFGTQVSRGPLRGVLFTLLAGPTDKQWIDPPKHRPYGRRLKHLATFDHEPATEEQEAVRDRRLSTTYLEPVPVKGRR